jgi:hypothetical protein
LSRPSAAFAAAPVTTERGFERAAQLVVDFAAIAPAAPVAQVRLEIRHGACLNDRAAMHQRVRSAQRRADASAQDDVDECASVAHAAHRTTRTVVLRHGSTSRTETPAWPTFRPARGLLSPSAMVEASSSPAPKKKKSAPPSQPQPSRARDTGGGLLTGWRTWAVVGVVFVGGVIGWKLVGSSYKSDVETICNAEQNSGFTMQKEPSKVTQYVRAHLATPEGNELFSALSDAKLAERAKHLKSEADAQKLSACPLVASYAQVEAEGEYRSDLQHLCSSLNFPKLAELDDDGRVNKLEDWIDQHAKSPRTKELAEPLRQGSPSARAALLRETTTKAGVYSCDVAKVLESPVLPAKGKGPPTVRPYATPQINGTLDAADLGKALAAVTPAMDDCYKKGLDKNPDLEGKLAVKVRFDPSGAVASTAPAEVTLGDREVSQCILQALKAMKVSTVQGPLVTTLIPLELTTAGPSGAPAMTPSAAPAPSVAPAPAPAPSAAPLMSAGKYR